MTSNMDLWKWFEKVQQNRSLRAAGTIRMKSSDRSRTDVTYTITGCLPVKLKAPALNGKDGTIAIEELGVAYETLTVRAGG
jgi:phage tail-like protein